MEAEIDCSLHQAQFTLRKPRIGKPFRTWTPNINKKGIKMKRSLIPMAVVLLIVSLSLDGSPAFGGDRGHARGGSGGGRGHGGAGRVSSGFSGGRHFGSMPARGGQMFARSGMGIRGGGHNWNRGTWSGQRWNGRNWSGRNWNGRHWNSWNGRNWSGSNWNGSLTNWNGGWGWWNGGRWWFPTSNVVFIGGFGFPWWWGWGWGPWSWGWWGYPSGFYGYGSQYGYYGPYGYGNPSYGYGNSYGSGYGNAGQYSSATRSRVAELQQRLTSAGYYRGLIDGVLGPQTQQAIRAYMEDHGYTSSSASPSVSPSP